MKPSPNATRIFQRLHDTVGVICSPGFLRFAVAAFTLFGVLNCSLAQTIDVRFQRWRSDPWETAPTRIAANEPWFDPSQQDTQLSPYGGCKAVRRAASGFFRVEKVDERWWIIDPDGCAFIDRGINAVRWMDSPGGWRASHQKFGTERAWMDHTLSLLRRSGFTTATAFSNVRLIRGSPTKLAYTPVLDFMRAYTMDVIGKDGHYPEGTMWMFANDFEAYCNQRAERLIAETEHAPDWWDPEQQLTLDRRDPWLLGYFLDNEIKWPNDALDRYLRVGSANPAASKAAAEWLERRRRNTSRDQLTDAERAEFLQYIAETYFRITMQAIRRVDPNHMILGCRFHGSVVDSPVMFREAARHCEITSVNLYGRWSPNESGHLDRWRSWNGDRPFMITEWYAKGADTGFSNKHGAGLIVATQFDRGHFYQNFALGLLDHPNCVGWHWYRYQDNDPKNAMTDSSNCDSNKGIVGPRYKPYTVALAAMRDLNNRVYRIRGITAMPASDNATSILEATPQTPSTSRSGDKERDGLATGWKSNGGGTTRIEHNSIALTSPVATPPTETNPGMLLHQMLRGDGSITARIAHLTNSCPDAKAGISLQATPNDEAARVSLLISPSTGLQLVVCPGNGKEAIVAAEGNDYFAPSYWNYCLRLVRNGEDIHAMQSYNGKEWTRIDTVPSPKGQLVAGLLVSHGNNSVPAIATFSDAVFEPAHEK